MEMPCPSKNPPLEREDSENPRPPARALAEDIILKDLIATSIAQGAFRQPTETYRKPTEAYRKPTETYTN